MWACILLIHTHIYKHSRIPSLLSHYYTAELKVVAMGDHVGILFHFTRFNDEEAGRV